MLKTGIAVTLSLYLAKLLQLDPIIIAALASVLSIQPSLYRSWQSILEQLQANLIGALLAITFVYLFGNEPFVIGFVVVLVIGITMQLRFEKSIPLVIFTVIAIMDSSTSGGSIASTLDRFLLVLLGISSSVMVNVLFLPPRYEDKLFAQVDEVTHLVTSYLRASIRSELEDKQGRQEVKNLQDRMVQLDQIYLLYQEERTYFRKVKYTKTRKLVLFRKMIRTSQQALTILKYIEKHKQEVHHLPQEVSELLDKEMEWLTRYHEKILLKYTGKLKKNLLPPNDKSIRGRTDLFQAYVHQAQQEDKRSTEEWTKLMPLFASIIDYSYQLEHLDHLLDGFFSHHEDKEQVK